MAKWPKPVLGKQATVSMMTARRIALKAYSGKIIKRELNQEIRRQRVARCVRYQVGEGHARGRMNAKTGKLRESSIEGADND